MLEDIRAERIKKLDELKKEGINPYPAGSKRTHTAAAALADFSALEKSKKKIYLTGRIRGLRGQGKIMFMDLEDISGRIQVVLKEDSLKKDFAVIASRLDVGDFVEISGPVFVTKRGEKSVEAKSIRILNKTLQTLPTEYYGLEDIETRLRHRYLDLLLNPEVKDIFVKKSRFWSSVRSYLGKEGFMEVETPVLELTPGGAEAEPFMTHYNALDQDFYLRISLEIALKKLMVGGFEKIFEIGRVFRNEGMDAEHLQDYTVLEFYWAYTDYNDLMKFIEKMYKAVIKETFGTLKFSYEGKSVDWGKKWKVVDYCEIFEEKAGLNPLTASQKDLFKKAQELKLKPDKSLGKGRLIDLLFKKTARKEMIEPCFLVNTPVDIEPLAKRHRDDQRKVERFQVVAYGSELGKGFSEANDPLDQRERFEEQMKLREKGDAEAQQLDEDFLEALEYGMPPTAGFGFSERLFAVLVGKPIRETVFFPPMRRKEGK